MTSSHSGVKWGWAGFCQAPWDSLNCSTLTEVPYTEQTHRHPHEHPLTLAQTGSVIWDAAASQSWGSRAGTKFQAEPGRAAVEQQGQKLCPVLWSALARSKIFFLKKLL